LDNILTIDLEEWYHPEYVKNKSPKNKEERLTKSLDKTLQMLNEQNVNATFFVVGELAEKTPEIIEKISRNEHEVAFHGYHHEPLWNLNAETLELEIRKFNSFTKEKCLGFRAPSFSLNNKTKWVLKVLDSAGYQYDSSVFPAATLLYGVRRAPVRPYKPSFENLAKEDENVKLWEFPLLVYPLARLRIPVAGGFYLRFFPVNLVKRAIKKVNKQGFPAVMFFHNWELDSETPRLNLGPYKSFVTYHKIKKTEEKLKSILSAFNFVSFRNYMEVVGFP